MEEREEKSESRSRNDLHIDHRKTVRVGEGTVDKREGTKEKVKQGKRREKKAKNVNERRSVKRADKGPNANEANMERKMIRTKKDVYVPRSS